MTRSRSEDQRGAATAELALGLPLLLVVTLGMVWLLAVGSAQLRVVDGAREAARALARGDPDAAAYARARQVAGPGSRVSAGRSGGLVTVRVTRRLETSEGLWEFLPPVRLEAEAVSAVESSP